MLGVVGLPGNAHGDDAVDRAPDPGDLAVDDRPVLPDVEVAPLALAGVVDAVHAPARGAEHGRARRSLHEDVQLVFAPCDLPELRIDDLPFGAEVQGLLEKSREHCRLGVHVCSDSVAPSACPMVPLAAP